MRNRFVASFDTEDDGNGNPYLFAIVHSRGAFTSSSRNKTLEYILTLARDLKQTQTTLELWATNLEYDLVNLFGEDRIAELSLRFGKSYLVGAVWTKHNVQFRDTVRHIPLSVKELGEIVGLEKLERKEGDKENEAYCVRDASITYHTAKYLYDSYAEFGYAPKQTLASTALGIWRDLYWRDDIKLPSDEILRNAKSAYYGGRTEAFAIGEYKDVVALDVASMFPWAMITKPLPVPWGPFRRVWHGEEITDCGIYRVRVASNIGYPFLPVRTSSGTVYPNGQWDGWYVGEELEYAASNGIAFEVLQGYEFLEQCEPFKGYVKDFYDKKTKSRGHGRLAYKLLLNALYGKFGQTGDRIVAIPLANFVKLRRMPDKFRIWNGIAIYQEFGKPPPWGNNVWPAFITSRARIRLNEEIKRIRSRGCTPLYCDTDSIIYLRNGVESVYNRNAMAIGNFEERGRYASIYIAGKKEYGLENNGEWEIHVKGVPKDARKSYLFTGLADFQKPMRLREAIRKASKPNVWSDYHKERHVNYDKRIRRPDGTLSPLIIRA